MIVSAGTSCLIRKNPNTGRDRSLSYQFPDTAYKATLCWGFYSLYDFWPYLPTRAERVRSPTYSVVNVFYQKRASNSIGFSVRSTVLELKGKTENTFWLYLYLHFASDKRLPISRRWNSALLNSPCQSKARNASLHSSQLGTEAAKAASFLLL